MRTLKRKGFSMLEVVTTMFVMCILFSINITMDYIYTKDQAKNSEEVETFMTISKDIQESLVKNGKPFKVSQAYMTFKDIETDCLYSYVYYSELHTFKKVVDTNCEYNINERTLIKDNVSNVSFKDTGNGTYSFEINYHNLEDKLTKPFYYSLHTPTYNLN